MNNSFMDWKNRTKPLGAHERFRLSFVVALFLMVLIGYQEWKSTREVSRLYHETIRATDVLRTLENLIWSANAIEADQQRYFVTRNRDFLNRARRESEKLRPILEQVRKLANQYQWERDFVARIDRIVTERIENTISPSDSIDSARLSERFNSVVHEFEEEERKVLKATQDGSAIAVGRSGQFVLSGVGFTLLIGFFSWFIADKELHRRKKAEEELKRAHDELEAILGGLDVGVFAMDVNGEILYANNMMAKLLNATNPHVLIGANRREVLKRFDVTTEDGTPLNADSAPSSHAAATRAPAEKLLRFRGPDEMRWVWQRAIPVFHSDGAVSMTISLFRDVTEQRKMEDLLREQQARALASSKLSALGEMAGGIAHEINNPLAIIQGQATQLKEMMENRQWEKEWMTEAAFSIEKTSKRIAKIVKGLRAFARDGSADPFRPTNLKGIIEETLDFCRERFKHHSVALHVDPIDPNLSIECRSVQISQVLLNLLNNAYDAVEELPERWIRIETRDAGETIEIAVTDSGTGIPLPFREKLMRPFFTTKEIGKGTGMGLSISRGIVESHGGTLIYDEHHPHTRFLASLPKTQTREENPESRSP